jgi:hypothetical protein
VIIDETEWRWETHPPPFPRKFLAKKFVFLRHKNALFATMQNTSKDNKTPINIDYKGDFGFRELVGAEGFEPFGLARLTLRPLTY